MGREGRFMGVNCVSFPFRGDFFGGRRGSFAVRRESFVSRRGSFGCGGESFARRCVSVACRRDSFAGGGGSFAGGGGSFRAGGGSFPFRRVSFAPLGGIERMARRPGGHRFVDAAEGTVRQGEAARHPAEATKRFPPRPEVQLGNEREDLTGDAATCSSFARASAHAAGFPDHESVQRLPGLFDDEFDHDGVIDETEKRRPVGNQVEGIDEVVEGGDHPEQIVV